MSSYKSLKSPHMYAATSSYLLLQLAYVTLNAVAPVAATTHQLHKHMLQLLDS